MAYRKEGAEEDLTSPAARREDKDGKSDCFQLMPGQPVGKGLLDPFVLEAGVVWEGFLPGDPVKPGR